MKTFDLFQTHSGSQTGDGEMREVEGGDWVKAEDAKALRKLIADLYATTKTLIVAGRCGKAQDDAWAQYTISLCPTIESEFRAELIERVGGPKA